MPAPRAVCGHAAVRRMAPQGKLYACCSIVVGNSNNSKYIMAISSLGKGDRSLGGGARCGGALSSDAGLLGQVGGTTRRRSEGRRCGVLPRAMALLDPPSFNPQKLKVVHMSEETSSRREGRDEGNAGYRRRYTLTHNDLTGCLTLSIGAEYNREQLSGWYTKIVRDEVLAEWIILTCSETNQPRRELHVYCHVSGEEKWPAPAPLRSFIFQREMKLVLDTISYADREMLSSSPLCQSACVYVHLASNLEPLNQKIAWGQLGDKSTWRMGPKGSLFDMLFSSSSYSSDDDDDDITGIMDRSTDDDWPVPGRNISNKVILEGVPSIIPAKLDSVSMVEAVANSKRDFSG